MADITFTSIEPSTNSLLLNGSNFTQTTTSVAVDGVAVAFTLVSAEQLRISEQAGEEVTVTKGLVSISLPLPGNPQESTMSDQSNPLTVASEDVVREQTKGPADPVNPAVEPGPLVEPVGVAAAEPYPTGSPPDPEDQFFAAHGFRRAPAE